VLVAGTGSYITPRLTQAGQIIISPNTEPRSLSDIINFTQKSSLGEFQAPPLDTSFWEPALRTVNRYLGTSQVYKQGCTNYTCPGGLPVPKDVETATITVSAGAVGVAVNPITNHVYVTGAARVSVIDGNTNTVLATINVQALPQGVGVNAKTNKVYVANQGSNTVSVINGTTNQVIKTITGVAFINSFPLNIGVNPTTNRVYVPTNNVGVVVIDGNTDTILTTIPIADYGVGVNPTTNRVYVANGAGGVYVINGTSNQVIGTPIPVGSQDYALAVNPKTNRVFVSNFASSSVSVINGTSSTVLTTIALGSSGSCPCPFGIGVNNATNRVYVQSGASSVSVIDGSTNTLLNPVDVGSPGIFPNGVGVNPNTNSAYVVNTGDSSVSVIGQREEIREACLAALANCLVVISSGTLFPGTLQVKSVNLVAISLRSNTTKTGTQMVLTIVCDNNTIDPNQQCFALYVDGNVWGPGQTDLSKSPFIIQNAEPYFYLQFHWWDFTNSQIVAWGTWWYGTASNPNWYWGVYWWWRTYVNYYIGIPYIPWWWWSWHWMYWRYWAWWGTVFQT
jgi:YVTN family beta-propeller protein